MACIYTEVALFCNFIICLNIKIDLTISINIKVQGVIMTLLEFQWGVLCGGMVSNPR
ncbi:hypothetical protein APORC_1708 [Arcobacter porcinus]|uniref:Uncharacterized protein n=1 Tax=Arcobacter porcinus TaxID=1935204 RepID=A0A5C2HGL1_9BACT|nr:hypothetical protein APORC_1708 [Arcobacter porcinus]